MNIEDVKKAVENGDYVKARELEDVLLKDFIFREASLGNREALQLLEIINLNFPRWCA